MAKKAKNKDEELHKAALEQFERGLQADSENRKSSLEDAKFVAGEQWPDNLRRDREASGRPCITINRMPMFIRQVANEVRMKPPNIQVVPVEEGDIETANVIEGLIRAIEAKSKAKRVYSKGIEDSARCNMGFWRVVTDFVSDDSFDQEILIKTIDNPLSVVFDPDARDPMLSDAKFCFIIETMTKTAFQAKYGTDAVAGIEGDETTRENVTTWLVGENVQVAEYWYVVEKPVELVQLVDGKALKVDEYDDLVQRYLEAVTLGEMVEPPVEIMRNDDGSPKIRKSIEKKVYSRIMSGGEFLDKAYEWAGNRIPIIPVWGEEFRVGERKIRHSVISNAKDAQMSLNFWRSAAVEGIALAPKAPWLVTGAMIEGYEQIWQSAGSGNPSMLPYNSTPDGRPERVMPAPINAAMLQEVQMSQDDLKATTGIFDAALGAQSNEQSGKAIIARQREGDVSTYVFVDNLLSAIEETARIILNIIPKIYDTARQIRILGKDKETKIVQVNQVGGIELAKGGYDVQIATGSSVTTQRQENAESFFELLRTAPNLAPILIPRLVGMLDIPDAKEISEELKQVGQGQPSQPNPKDIASAEKMKAETMGISLDNQAKFKNLQAPPMPEVYPSY